MVSENLLHKFEEIIVCFLLLIISFYLEYSQSLTNIIKTDFENPNFLTGLFIIMVFMIYLLHKDFKDDKRDKILESLKKSLTALVIAYLAHLDLIFVPFWLIFSLAYFFHDWV